MKKRGQASVEYMIIIGFVSFAVAGIAGVAFLYTSDISQRIGFYQLEKFEQKIISSAEDVYYKGEPSKSTFVAYLPKGITKIQITSGELVFSVSTKSGTNIISYSSNVPIQGSISSKDGVKKIKVEAFDSYVMISEVS